MSDAHIEQSVTYLKAQKELDNIDDIEPEQINCYFRR